ncbi:low temperature requirement protein A [Halalkalicoccus jeotgali]|uniref:Low temperature requirement protein A n=1 Tax=Halalkalicoccus jeotgali (strain DSM 18796 / CECT 7217 / JCM 14584 / KCTC 4019 / B3) TaxID=795797 RepID=D8JBQ8_HALJB|nr:low temperature requirement protein A [Halalkalicoccus jeotgali]ADJ16711.1 low temperature requirement protein A [Halalkalicoccus jeotgali B3]ELY40842.1 low temperature requirement protein A [Halalkalicoccus jeotgali B3]
MPEQDVTPLELFFDLVFVFAFTQVTGFLVDHLTWTGMIRGAALFAALWWAWVTYSWLTGAVPAEERLPARLVILTAMSAMLIVALAVPDAFGDDGVLFGVAYFVVRALHVVLYAVATPPETRDAVLRAAPGFLGGPALLVVAGLFDGPLAGGLWIAALAIDYGIVFVRGVEGFHVNVGHFVERHRLVLIIALGESLIAIGVGAEELLLSTDVVLAALFGIALIIALWWLYFDYVVLAAEQTLAAASGHDQTRMARDSYSYIHLLMVGSIIFIALGIEQTVAHVSEPLGTVAAAALFGGAALYLLGHNAFRYRDHGNISLERLVVTIITLMLLPVAVRVPAIVALGGITMLFIGLAAYETVRNEHRHKFRTS